MISVNKNSSRLQNRHHNSGGTGFTASQSITPRTLNQNFAQCGPLMAPPILCSRPRALIILLSSSLAPNNRSTTYVMAVPNTVLSPSICRPQPPSSGFCRLNRYLLISVLVAFDIGVSVTYQVMTIPGRRNIGPPYSQAQFPGGSCNFEKNDKALCTEANGVFALGRLGKSLMERLSALRAQRAYYIRVLTKGSPKKYLSATDWGHSLAFLSVSR